MNLYRSLFLSTTYASYRSFVSATRDPEKSQNALWQETFGVLKNAEFWKKSFSGNNTPSLAELDVTCYQDYDLAIAESNASGISKLNGEQLLYCSTSGGSTGKAKPFPLTKSHRRQFQRTVGPLIHSLCRRFPKFMANPVLYQASAKLPQEQSNSVEIGQISHFNYRNIPKLLQSRYVLPYEILRDEATLQQWAPLFALSQDLSAIFAVTPFRVQAFLENLKNKFEFYLPYIMGEKKLPEDLPAFKMSKQRQAYLQALSKKGNWAVKDLWPTLQFICCWKSAICSETAQVLESMMQVPVVDSIYSAVEGWMTVSLDDCPGGVFHPGAHVVEFIENGQDIHKKNLIKPWELEVGKQYEVFLTTAMGMVRYRLKDVIECYDHFNRSPCIKFCHKSEALKFELFAVSEDDIKSAVAISGIKFDPLWFFTHDRHYRRIILVTDVDPSLMQDGISKMNQLLVENNRNYKEQIRKGSASPLAAVQLPREKFLSNIHGQYKPVLLKLQAPDYVLDHI